MADSLEARMSVTSIKRVDPYVKRILATATHVALYKFNTTTNEWEKTETEGALFIYSRNGEPFHSIMVMNRLNTNNLIEPIVRNFDYQMQVPFLLYRNAKSKIFGIWFFNRDECINITCLIETIMDELKERSSSPMMMKASSSKQASNGGGNSAVDIFSMLSRAQEDFNKTPTSTIKNADASMIIPSTATFSSSTPRRGPNTGTGNNTVVDVTTSKSVMDFFAKATTTKSTQKPAVEPNEHVLQRLMSNPVHSVEHIEKQQQRSVTPQDQASLLRQKPTTDRRSVPITFPNSSTTAAGPSGERTTDLSSMSSPLAFLLNNSNAVGGGAAEGTTTAPSPFSQFFENKPHLMTPMMFTQPPTIDRNLTNNDCEKIVFNNHDHNPIVANNNVNNNEQIDLLTEKQLAQVLIHLLKTNSNFTKQIHEAYVNSLMDRGS